MGSFRSTTMRAVALFTMLVLGLAVGAVARAAGKVDHGQAVAAGPRALVGAGALPPGHDWTVTLITGDIVTVRTVKGRPPLVTIRPGPNRTHVIFTKFAGSAGHVVVTPHDVAPLVGRILDPALFDVTTLIANGDDDAHRAFLPLIVQGGQGGQAAGHITLPSSLHRGLVLSSIDAIAAAEPKAAAAQEGAVLAAMTSAVVRAGRAAPQLTGGIRHIWLDRTVRAARRAHSGSARRAGLADAQPRGSAVIDHNLVQIGAPVAWRAGDTGRGIKVAVLDTGVDASFPDLRGQILASKNFTSHSPGVADRVGHGTLVASLIAGTGRAAQGQRRGVAFGARLVVGKVLGDDGTGLESWVIAGMQWAATRAKIISMSLGSLPSDGTDPQSMAVDRLTASDHVLFVIAAGNFGPLDESVASPAAATAALAVGAVDGGDRLAIFSSRGPRLGDFAIKPEIVAPGVDIVGARAAGTAYGTPIDAAYTMSSGTSFAAPQVAGAAAILAGLHPRWSPAQLKADLVSTAHHAAGGDAYQLGGGRIDIAAEVTDPVVADQAVAGLGVVPDGSAGTISDPLSWTNIGTRPATIELSATLTDHAGRQAPGRTIGLSAVVLRIGAGGSKTATLAARPALLAGHAGLYEGQVTARDGSRVIRTPISLYVRPATHTLTIRATPLPGTGAGAFSASATVVDVSDPDLFQAVVTVNNNGIGTVQVPAGHYWVVGEVDDFSKTLPQRSAMMGQPEMIVNGDTTVTFNGAAAVPVTASVTGRPTITTGVSVHVERVAGGQVFGADVLSFAPPPSTPVIFAQPTGTARTGTFHAYSTFRLESPPSSHVSYVYDLYHLLGSRVPASAAYVITPAGQARLATVLERFYAIAGNRSTIGEQRYGLTAAGFLSIQNLENVPGASGRTDYVTAGPGISWLQDIAPPFTIRGMNLQPDWVIVPPGFTRYQPGSRQIADWVRQPFAPGPFSATAALPSASACAPSATTRSRGNIHVELVDLQDIPDGFDCLGGAQPQQQWAANTSRVMRLYLGSRLIGTRLSSVADFPVPSGAGRYRLSYSDNTSQALPVSTQTDTTWTFDSPAPATPGLVGIPLLLVRYDLPLGLDNHLAGSTAVLTVTRVAGTPRAGITSVRLWTSTDGGRTWRAAPVRHLGGDRFSATVPQVPKGTAVSLRVQADDAGGSSVDQKIMTAYRG